MPSPSSAVSVNFSQTNLFRPLKINSQITLSHRVALAPLTRMRVSDTTKADINLPLVQEHYRQRSQRPGTLIISEALPVSKDHTLGLPAGFAMPIFLDENINDWGKVLSTVHSNKSFMFLQLWWGITGSAGAQHKFINEVSEDKLDQVLQRFVTATEKALEINADGVEIHFANGYTLTNFLNPGVNQRKDQYGGSIENQSRFLLRVLDTLGDKFGYDKIGVRISPFHRDANERLDSDILASYSFFVSQLEKRRFQGKELAYIHAVEPRQSLQDDRFDGVDTLELHENIEFIPAIWNGNIIRAGNYIKESVKASRVLEHPRTILAFGRYFISNPDLPDKLEHGWELNEYQRQYFYTREELGYNDYPRHEETA
ncbi:hypothetical protein WICPIJ_003305 [Wickerhamomyces pijperi]|uniref:NADH:flavin oxidoreductase/NADH oxidase N-terminal domain-containing protein n=1 Tax=Wickerhamomyces pijperi TaxID=599730 RepID=A0A9P8QA16_WICPI|nr:hypothetical protein WICPIJ_003305 [Wickerhamomyces pijperi]